MKRTCAFSILLLGAAAFAVAQPPIKKAPTYTISGNAGSGSVNMFGNNVKRTATHVVSPDNSVTYQFSGVAPGTYILHPWLQGCTFEPAERTVTVTNANLTGVSFAPNCPGPKKDNSHFVP